MCLIVMAGGVFLPQDRSSSLYNARSAKLLINLLSIVKSHCCQVAIFTHTHTQNRLITWREKSDQNSQARAWQPYHRYTPSSCISNKHQMGTKTRIRVPTTPSGNICIRTSRILTLKKMAPPRRRVSWKEHRVLAIGAWFHGLLDHTHPLFRRSTRCFLSFRKLRLSS